MQVFAEAGGQVVPNARIKDLRLGVDPSDKRLVEFSVYGLPLYRGVPLLCDSTQGSPLHVDGKPHPHTCTEDGATCSRLEKPKNSTYAEVVQSSGYKLVTLACEVGGRWSDTTCQLLRDLAKEKSQSAPPRLRRSTAFAWENRWWGMLSVAAQNAFAATLVDDAPHLLHAWEGSDPPLGVLLHGEAPTESRLPLR